MVQQIEIILKPKRRGFHLVTSEIVSQLPKLPKTGIVNIFTKTLSGVSITIPITDGRLNLGTWQGIYFCEFRNYGGSRELVVTIIGE